MPSPFHIVCLSHLVWEETLFQRPQQLMSRLAARGHTVRYFAQWPLRRALVVCGRALFTGPGQRTRLCGTPAPGLAYWNLPNPPGTRHVGAMRALAQARLGRLACRSLEEGRAAGKPRILWIYYPDYFSIVQRLESQFDLLVYDCMDHFAGFRSERADAAECERRLAQTADIVFAGGRSLHASICDLNPRSYCFPSGVDADHFALATRPETAVPPDLEAIARPRLGYFGAVDERIDWPLVRDLCRRRRDWSVVFLGPLVLMKQCPVADEPNFHYLGAKPYAVLPAYLKGFDACLMPFVQSELVAHISPTKTPEYLAGGRPVVSTPVPDVVADYADDVLIASGAEKFAAACARALERGPGPSHKPQQSRTWDEIAAQMEGLLFKRLAEKRPGVF